MAGPHTYDRALGLFARRPDPGAAKTRLRVGPEGGARVARAFLLDALTRFSVIDARRFVAFTPADAAEEFADMAAGRWTPVAQGDGDLGRRMATFIADRLAEGAEAVVLVGADSPTLPPAYVEQTFAELRTTDVVLGPATDGGYYLIGCGRRIPPVFDGVDWGTDRVLAQTVARLTDASWRLALLPAWYDVDTPAAWAMLCGHLAAMRRAGMDPRAQHTEALARETTP
jgi:rSAM/selenodomain-associated transferase 1